MRIVGGMWKGRPIEAPDGRDVTRPTTDRTRESMASMVLSAFGLDLGGVSVLDAFGGSGAIGFELLSRGAASCTFVDRDRGAVARIRRNARALGAGASARVLPGDVFKLAERGAIAGAPFSLLVLDPPYAVGAREVERLAGMSVGAGADGIVCSPQEAAQMRELLGPKALIVTPGVRPKGAAVGDQKRIATPASAIGAGASMLVIGRPITQADDPVEVYEAVVRELCEA